MTINLYNQDCMESMRDMPDNAFDLAIVDPPYGIKQDGHRENNRSKLAKSKVYHKALWDQIKPGKYYFEELCRVSNNQIIWGGNFFVEFLPPSSGWIVWDKNRSCHFSDCELAYSSFHNAIRKFKWTWDGMRQENMRVKEQRIHPTQKPVALYKWLLSKYANPGDKILDTHLGSGSIAIACHDLGFDLEAYELERQYYEDAVRRLNVHKSQLQIAFKS